jgi:hypothetical protein
MRSGAAGTPAEGLLQLAPSGYGVRGWGVGEWARYAVSENVGGPMPLSRFRTISVVGRSGERYWVEAVTEFSGMTSGTGPTTRYLLGFGPIREPVGEDYYVLMPDSGLMRQRVLRRGGGDRGRPAFPEGWSRIGEEEISVAAGSFRTVHWRKGSEDLWTSADAGPVGIVKYTSGDVQMELADRGASGARTRVNVGGN